MAIKRQYNTKQFVSMPSCLRTIWCGNKLLMIHELRNRPISKKRFNALVQQLESTPGLFDVLFYSVGNLGNLASACIKLDLS